MATINDILDGHSRAVVLEALYLASHELTCSTRLDAASVAQNSALSDDEGKEAIDLANELTSWFVDLEKKPLSEFDDRDRAKLAKKLSGYRGHNLFEPSEALDERAKHIFDEWAAQAA